MKLIDIKNFKLINVGNKHLVQIGKLISIFTIFTAFCSNYEKPNNKIFANKEDSLKSILLTKKTDSIKIILQNNIDFFSEKLLNGNKDVIHNYFSKYQTDTCGIIVYDNSLLQSEFKGIKALCDINGNKKADSVFVIPPFNYCDDGESYCFLDKSLPRLFTDSYCCHPDNLFVIEDIDEDGIKEIGIFYSSCVSRFKSLRIYSLKQQSWKEIGISIFDIQTQSPTKVKFEKLVKKVSKNKFIICEFNKGKTNWIKINMK